MSENAKPETTDLGGLSPDHIDRALVAEVPLPWRVVAPNKQYIQIVDAGGNRVCDFFPFAQKGGRGWDRTQAIADQIVRWANQDG
jgi:uncharacterized protein YcgI (DUF1989 family)